MASGSAVRVGLDRDAVVGLAHPDLVGGAAGELEPLRLAPAALDLQLQVGDRAVERVVLGALRVRVDPGDEVAGLRRRPARGASRPCPRSGTRSWSAASSTFVDRMRSKPPRRCSAPSMRSIPLATQGVVSGPILIRPAAMSKKLPRSPAEVGALDPHPALGVLGAPVVADHPGPAGDLDPLAADRDLAVEARARVGAQELGPGQRGVVEALVGEVVERLRRRRRSAGPSSPRARASSISPAARPGSSAAPSTRM